MQRIISVLKSIDATIWRACLYLAKTSRSTLLAALVHQMVLIALAFMLIVGGEVRPRMAVVIVVGVLVAVFVSYMEQKKLWLILSREWDKTIWEIDEKHRKEKEALIAWYTQRTPEEEPKEEQAYWEFTDE